MLSVLTEDDLGRLEEQRQLIRSEVRARYGEALRDDMHGLEQLQRLLDDKAFALTQRYELQCMGVCWGDVLCALAPFRWMMITDEYGHDPTLQWKETSINIHALTMISKRVEDGEGVDLRWLADKAIERAAELEANELNDS